MSIRLDFFKNSISSVLERNPMVSNDDLAGMMRANISNFDGDIQISDLGIHSFQSDGYEGKRLAAKRVYISPYGFWTDLLVSIKRVFTGIEFLPSVRDWDLRSDLLTGRRITIFCSIDGKEAEILSEENQKPLFSRLFRTVFGNCC